MPYPVGQSRPLEDHCLVVVGGTWSLKGEKGRAVLEADTCVMGIHNALKEGKQVRQWGMRVPCGENRPNAMPPCRFLFLFRETRG